MSKNTPEIRFKGFSDEWEQRKLGEMSESFEYGLNVSAKSYDGRNKYLRITDIDESSRNFVTDKLTSPNTDLSTSDNYLLKKGDILFARTGASVGKSYHYNRDDGKVYYAGFLIRARIKTNYNSSFIFQNTLTDKYMNYIKVTSQRSGQPGVNAKEYSDYSLMVPKNVEQSKIGSFFKLLDNTIALHQQKVDLLNQSKRGLLQKMFPEIGENVPKIRLRSFSGGWIRCMLGDYTNIQTGSGDLQDANADGEYPFFVRSENVERSSRYIYDGEAILVPGEGRLGEIYHYINDKFDYHQRVYKISDFNDVNALFILYFMKRNFKRHAMKYTVKATVDSLRLPMLKEFPVLLPSLEEQQKIGYFFKHLDDKITIHEDKIKALKQTKKALLQKMFI